MGVVTVDDVLELVLPQGWRRHFIYSETTTGRARRWRRMPRPWKPCC